MKNGHILIVEDDQTFRGLLAAILEGAGHKVSQAVDGVAGLAKLKMERYDLVLSDLKMPKMSGIELFNASRILSSPPPFVLITAFGTIEEAVVAIKEGVSDFLTKPLKDPATLRSLVDRLLVAHRMEQQMDVIDESELAGLPPLEIMFAGAAMVDVRRLAGEVAGSDATVLIGGESGTGKELLARYIHLVSQRRKGAFVAVNCAAIPENLLESELFGHERGAFTGASASRQGKFEAASGGTIMLDEIGEMPLAMQAKLLRVLQEKKFERVGGNKEMRADVRVIAASNRDLGKESAAGNFREDLFYRLNVFPIKLPPLRDRRDAIDNLALFFVRLHARAMGKKLSGIAAPAMKILRAYNWPGNIRELQNIIERAVILARGEVTAAEFPDSIRAILDGQERDEVGILKEAEREAIVAAIKATAGNRRLAAERLGISRRTLQYRLKEYGLISADDSE
jgi:DNA-binding NtrC family response regulator